MPVCLGRAMNFLGGVKNFFWPQSSGRPPCGSATEPRPWTSGLETETETWTKLTRVHSSLESMVSRSQHW